MIESAHQLSRFCDIYKAEFPGHLGNESDAQLEKNLKALDAVSERPWVLLSAGVDFPAYKQQVEMAMKAGASGILGGRAFWKEYFLEETEDARKKFANTVCNDRVLQIHEIVKAKGKPWFSRYGLTMDELHRIRVAEGWHFRYGGNLKSTGNSKAGAPGEVY